MKYELFQRIALARDLPEKQLQRGDVATIVDRHPPNGGEPGYSIEVFNALGGHYRGHGGRGVMPPASHGE